MGVKKANSSSRLNLWSVFCSLVLLVACDAAHQLSTTKSAQTTETQPADHVNKNLDGEPTLKSLPQEFAADEDWSFFRGDTKSTGVARTSLPDELDVLWEYKVEQGAFEGTPTIVGGNPKTVYIGDLDGNLFAFNLDTGEVLWQYKVEIGFVTAPVFKDGRVFVGDIDGIFYCLDSKGELVWKFQSNAEIDSSANFFADNVLFGSQDSKLYALNQKTGDIAWEFETADQVRCSITVVDNRAFVAGCDGGLHIIDIEQGQEVSSVNIESPTGVTPAIQGDIVFVGTEQSGFYAIDWKTAKVKWKFAPDASLSIRSSPAVTKEHVVFGAQNRTVYSLDPESGRENWATALKAKIDSSPVIVGSRVFVAATDGRLYALDLASGEIMWEKQLNGGVIGSPAVAFGRLVVATDRGVVYCLGSKEQFAAGEAK